MLITYFEIGRMIVDDEQQGKHRADYAKQTLINLSTYLNKEFGKGYSLNNLQSMRNFYLTYQIYETSSRISQINNQFHSIVLSPSIWAVAKFATAEFFKSSSSVKIFFICLEITDLSLSNKTAIWFNDSHTVSSSSLTNSVIGLVKNYLAFIIRYVQYFCVLFVHTQQQR